MINILKKLIVIIFLFVLITGCKNKKNENDFSGYWSTLGTVYDGENSYQYSIKYTLDDDGTGMVLYYFFVINTKDYYSFTEKITWSSYDNNLFITMKDIKNEYTNRYIYDEQTKSFTISNDCEYDCDIKTAYMKRSV